MGSGPEQRGATAPSAGRTLCGQACAGAQPGSTRSGEIPHSNNVLPPKHLRPWPRPQPGQTENAGRATAGEL